jgi:Tfp pilus assembly protein PilV
MAEAERAGVIRSASPRVRARAADERGISLVEVLVSALICALIATAVALALMAGADTDADQRYRSQAAELAQQDQERLKGLSALQLTDLAPPDQETRTVTLNGIPYQITSTANFLNSTSGAACGSSGAGAAAYYQVISQVTWGINHRGPVTYASLITPPAGGTLLTDVEDQTGAPLPGVSVTATEVPADGSDTASATTDSSGCAIFSDLNTGDYTLALTDVGYVDQDDQPADPLDISATVTSTGTATPSGGNPIILGLAGTFSANFTTSTNGTTMSAGQQADAVSWYGAGTADSMSSYECETSSATAPTTCPATSTSSDLTPAATLPTTGSITAFPFEFTGPSYTGNYSMWAGACKQEQPPTNYDSFNVSPGSSQTVAIQEPLLDLTVNYNGSRVAPAHVKIRFVSSSGTTCTDPTSSTWFSAPIAANAATATTGVLADPGQPFASTDTSGSWESASTKTGTLTICADYNNRNVTITGVVNKLMNAMNPATINITNSSSFGTCTP